MIKQINGFIVPMPETKQPPYATRYYYPAPHKSEFVVEAIWEGWNFDLRLLLLGLVFSTQEAAVATAKAMLGIDPDSSETEKE